LSTANLRHAVFGKGLTELAAIEPKLVTITAAMPSGTGTGGLREYPDRFFDAGRRGACGTFAAGMATRGCGLSVRFTRRSATRVHNVIHDVRFKSPRRVCDGSCGLLVKMDRAHGLLHRPSLRSRRRTAQTIHVGCLQPMCVGHLHQPTRTSSKHDRECDRHVSITLSYARARSRVNAQTGRTPRSPSAATLPHALSIPHQNRSGYISQTHRSPFHSALRP